MGYYVYSGRGGPLIPSQSSPPLVHQPSWITEEQIRSTQLRTQGMSGIVSPQILQLEFRDIQASSEGEEEDPCGRDQGLEQLGYVSGGTMKMCAEEVSTSVNVHMSL